MIISIMLLAVNLFSTNFESPEYIVGHLDNQAGWQTKNGESYFNDKYPYSIIDFTQDHGQVMKISTQMGGNQTGELKKVETVNLTNKIIIKYDLYLCKDWADNMPKETSSEVNIIFVAGTKTIPFGFIKSETQQGWKVMSTFIPQSLPIEEWIRVEILADSKTKKVLVKLNDVILTELPCESWGTTKIWEIKLYTKRTIDNKFTYITTYVDNLSIVNQ